MRYLKQLRMLIHHSSYESRSAGRRYIVGRHDGKPYEPNIPEIIHVHQVESSRTGTIPDGNAMHRGLSMNFWKKILELALLSKKVDVVTCLRSERCQQTTQELVQLTQLEVEFTYLLIRNNNLTSRLSVWAHCLRFGDFTYTLHLESRQISFRTKGPRKLPSGARLEMLLESGIGELNSRRRHHRQGSPRSSFVP